jgi:tRNA(Ile)-lysidine synthase
MTGISARNEKVIRPLLCCTREEIETYIIGHDLENITDSTNATVDYQRNKFRNVVLPLLEEINPSVRQTLYNSLERFEGTLAIYDQAIGNIRDKVLISENDLVKLKIAELQKQVDVPTVLYELLQPYGFGKAVLEQITKHLEGESGKLFYSDTHRLLKDRDYLIINKIESASNEEYFITENKTEINIPFQLKISKIKLNSDFQVSKEKNCIHVDASRLSFPLHLRRWNEGDSFFPFGMNKRKKVSDFFIDNKLSIIEKEQSWLLLSGDEIVWVVGQRMDNRYRVTDETTDVFQFTIS